MAPIKLKIDPEIRDAVPPLRDEELAGLEALILRDGCTNEIFVWRENNVVLDGHHRYKICLKHGIGYRVRGVSLPDQAAAVRWVRERALRQRNLNEFQRNEISLQLKGEIAFEAETRKKAGKTDLGMNSRQGGRKKSKSSQSGEEPGPKSREGRTNAAVAKLARTSEDSVRKVEAIKEFGIPELVEMVRTEEVSTDAGYLIATTLPKPEQAELVKLGARAIRDKAAEIRRGEVKPEPPKVTVDRKGNTITDPKVAEIFGRADEIQKFITQMSHLKSEVLKHAESDPLWCRLNVSSFTAAANNVHRDLRFAMPYARCPACSGDGGLNKNCLQCHGSGWLNEQSYDALPDREKER